jgi:uncharacterized protein (DUF1015 family)
MIVQAFRGVRPRRDLADRIPSLPYDVVEADEARRIAAHDPYTFLHVVRSEVDLPPDVDPYDERVYAKARENLDGMLDRGWLVPDAAPAYYVYRLEMDGRSQTGILGLAAVSDYVEGRIRRHELTRPEKEADRVRHAEAISAHAGPVFLAYRDFSPLDSWIDRIVTGEPSVDFVAPGDVRHTLWVEADPAAVTSIERAFTELPATYIADGHHRAASYARLAEIAHARNPGAGALPHDHFLAAHFPASQLRILGYNRGVRDLNGLSAATFLAKVREAGFFPKEGKDAKIPTRPLTFGMYLDDHWYLLLARPDPAVAGDPVRSLDVSVLSERLLRDVLGIQDPRTDPRLDFVGGIKGAEELERLVDSGKDAIAFSVYPPGVEDVMAVADAGLVMPPKSTWFEPKLRSGMVVHLLDGEGRVRSSGEASS